MFNTHTGNQIIQGIPGKVAVAMKKIGLPGRFDALFGLTFGLNSNDAWMHDNEYGEDMSEFLEVTETRLGSCI